MIWLTMSGYVLAMRSELGTVIASTPLVDRARTRKVLPFRSSSIYATVTGALRKSVLRTGSSRIRSSSALLTRCAAEDERLIRSRHRSHAHGDGGRFQQDLAA